MDPEEQALQAEEDRLRQIAEGATGEDPAPQDDPPPDEEPEVAAAESDEATPAPSEDPPPDEEPEETPPTDEAPAPRPGRTLERRISTLAAQKRALEERVRQLEANPAPAAEPGETPPAFSSQEEFNAAVAREARRQADARAFNDRCNAIEDAGFTLDAARWAAAKRTLGLLDDNGVIPMALLEPALEAEKPELVLLMLGEDPDRASELLAMTPTKRAMEIAKMTAAPAKKTAPPPRSAAPPPVEPIGRRATAPASTGPSDRDSDGEWLRKRNEQLAAKRRAERAAQA